VHLESGKEEKVLLHYIREKFITKKVGQTVGDGDRGGSHLLSEAIKIYGLY